MLARQLLSNTVAPALLWLAVALPCAAQHRADRFERITPEQAGYSSEELDKLREKLRAAGSQSMLLLHDGKVFFECRHE